MRSARIRALTGLRSYPIESVVAANRIAVEPSSEDEAFMQSPNFVFNKLDCEIEYEVVLELTGLRGKQRVVRLEVSEKTYEQASAYLASQYGPVRT